MSKGIMPTHTHTLSLSLSLRNTRMHIGIVTQETGNYSVGLINE